MSLFSSLSCNDEGAEAYSIIAAQLSTRCMNYMLHQTEHNKNVELLLSQRFIFLQTRGNCGSQSVARALSRYFFFYLFIHFFLTPSFFPFHLSQPGALHQQVLQYQILNKCLPFLFSLHPFSFTTVLYWQLWGDGEDPAGPRSQRQRSGQRAVDAAARRRYLWPRRTGQDPHCTVRHADTLHQELHQGFQLWFIVEVPHLKQRAPPLLNQSITLQYQGERKTSEFLSRKVKTNKPNQSQSGVLMWKNSPGWS